MLTAADTLRLTCCAAVSLISVCCLTLYRSVQKRRPRRTPKPLLDCTAVSPGRVWQDFYRCVRHQSLSCLLDSRTDRYVSIVCGVVTDAVFRHAHVLLFPSATTGPYMCSTHVIPPPHNLPKFIHRKLAHVLHVFLKQVCHHSSRSDAFSLTSNPSRDGFPESMTRSIQASEA